MKLRTKSRKKSLFIEAIQRGASITAAATYAGVDRSTPYQWEKEDREFALQWDQARETQTTHLLETAYELAIEGNVQLLKFLITRADTRESRSSGQQEPTQAEIIIVQPQPAVSEVHTHEHTGSFISISKS